MVPPNKPAEALGLEGIGHHFEEAQAQEKLLGFFFEARGQGGAGGGHHPVGQGHRDFPIAPQPGYLLDEVDLPLQVRPVRRHLHRQGVLVDIDGGQM